MKKTFYSNGKLLITGEYLVLDGARSFALPTKFGQNLIVEEGSNKEIQWKSFDSDGSIWFEDSISFDAISKKNLFENETLKSTLTTILNEAYILNPEFINTSSGYKITTELSFPKKWGLGTSSTLINNIAQWTTVDAFELLYNSFGGSGYDIACAQNNSPILYHLEAGRPSVEKLEFNPEFTKNIYFVYLNKKQSSKTAITSYHNSNKKNIAKSILIIDKITNAAINSTTAEQFALLMEEHEAVMSAILEIETVKEALFPDFNGIIKSLGAWGGDFVMVISKDSPTSYFKERGFETIIPYQEMILESIQR
jgi:mevalonate kinase